MGSGVWELSLSVASTPERLITGIVAGLTFWIDAGDCAGRFGGFDVYGGIFSGCCFVGKVGG